MAAERRTFVTVAFAPEPLTYAVEVTRTNPRGAQEIRQAIMAAMARLN